MPEEELLKVATRLSLKSTGRDYLRCSPHVAAESYRSQKIGTHEPVKETLFSFSAHPVASKGEHNIVPAGKGERFIRL